VDYPFRCYHAQQILPIYCINCQSGIAIPDTMINENAKAILEAFKTLYSKDQEQLRHLAIVLADLSLADSLGYAYAKQPSKISSQYATVLDTFKQQVLDRYQVASGHRLPDEIAHLAFVPRLKTYEIDNRVLLESKQLHFLEDEAG
jgi:hypothetical protein